MESRAQSFDICIVCALYEEAEAVLNEFSTRCNVSFTKAFSGMDRYVYQHTTIWNKRREPLTILVTWLSDSGPTQTGLDLKPFLHEFQPRFVAMTGICAGYKGKVKLGDLVVAQYAYYYEEGKVVAPDKIPEELIRNGVAQWSPLLQQAVADLFTFNQIVEELLKFSLMQRLAVTQTLGIHRLVQAVQIDTMEPDFSPIEEAFSKIKTVLRSIGARTREALQEALEYALTTVTSSDASAWFRHCGYQVPDSLKPEAA